MPLSYHGTVSVNTGTRRGAKQANKKDMIRKIFLALYGLYIKKQAWRYSGTSVPHAERMYQWITDAPVRQWRMRLWCVRNGQHDCGKLYDWLTGQSKGNAAPHKA